MRVTSDTATIDVIVIALVYLSYITMATQKPRLNVTLDEKERQMLEEIADRRGISLARVVGQLIREEYDRNYRRKRNK